MFKVVSQRISPTVDEFIEGETLMIEEGDNSELI